MVDQEQAVSTPAMAGAAAAVADHTTCDLPPWVVKVTDTHVYVDEELFLRLLEEKRQDDGCFEGLIACGALPVGFHIEEDEYDEYGFDDE